MRLLYIDESYSSKLYVLGAVLVNDTGYNTFQYGFNKFLSEKFNLAEDSELHADHLWNGKGFWSKFTMDERAGAVKMIAEYLACTKLCFIVASSFTTKSNDHDKYFELLPKIIEFGVGKTSSGSGSTKKHLMIIFDERADLRQERSIFLAIATKKKEAVKKFKKTCTIFDYGYEGISSFSRALQAADFIAFFYKAYLELQKNPSLFSGPTNKKKIDLLEMIFGKILNKKITRR